MTQTQQRLNFLLKSDARFGDADLTYMVYLHPNDTRKTRAKFRMELWNFYHKHSMTPVRYQDAKKIAKTIIGRS